MSKNTFSPKGQRYEAPQAEIIAIESQSVLCASPGGGGEEATDFGAGTTNMTMIDTLVW